MTIEEYTGAVAQIIANNTDCTLLQARNLCGDLTEMLDEGLSPDEAAREIAAAADDDL